MKYICGYKWSTREWDKSYQTDYNTNEMTVEELLDILKEWNQEDKKDGWEYSLIDDINIYDYIDIRISDKTKKEMQRAVEAELTLQEAIEKYHWIDVVDETNFYYTKSYWDIHNYLSDEDNDMRYLDDDFESFCAWTGTDTYKKVEEELNYLYGEYEQSYKEACRW